MFNIYFHDNLSNKWTEDSFIKSNNFKNIKDIEQFINYCITKNKSRVLNIHQYRMSFFDSNYHPLLETFKGEKDKDFGELRIAIKFGNINSLLKSDEKWNPKIYWQTYENIPKVIKDTILLFSTIDLKEYNLAGFTVIMKQDIIEFRWLIYKIDDKYEKIKELARQFINYQIKKKNCPIQTRCNGIHFEQF